MIKILSIQEAFLQKNLVAEIEIEAITPILVGGFDTKTYHSELGIYEPLRPSSIKGVWRWWARALIAAAYSDLYYKYIDLVTADKIIEKLLGSSQQKIGQSKYILHVEEKLFSQISISALSDISRIKFIKKYDQAINSGSKYLIKIYRSKKTDSIEDEFAVSSLLNGLIFDGIGKITSRGFGKVRILRINPSRFYEKYVKQIYGQNDSKSIENALINIVNESLNIAKNFLKFTCKEKTCIRNNKNELSLIELPLIEKNLMFIIVPNKVFQESLKALQCIGNVILKTYHKALRIKNQNKSFSEALKIARKKTGENIHTWVLGLPRSPVQKIEYNTKKYDLQRIKEKLSKSLELELKKVLNKTIIPSIIKQFYNLIKVDYKSNNVSIPTGYYYILLRHKQAKLSSSRRRSPIRFTIIPLKNTYYIVIYGFKTYDWEKVSSILLHIGAIWTKEEIKGKLKITNVKKFKVRIIKVEERTILSNINKIISDIKRLIENNYCLQS